MERSKGHIATIGDFEYFERDCILYVAPIDRPLDIWGYRLGARFECYTHMTTRRIAYVSQQVARFA